MNRDHSYYPYNNNEQPLEVEWQAPEQNDIAGNTQWNGSTYHGSYQNHNRYSGGSGEPPKQKPPKKPIKLWVNCLWCSSMFGNISRLHWWIHRFGKYGSNPIFRFRYKQFQFYCEYYQSRK